MVVIGLITVASGFAYSSILPYAEQYRLKGATMAVAVELQRARIEAVRTRLCHFFDRIGTAEFRIVRDNAEDQNCTLDPSDTTISQISLGESYPGVTMATSGASVDPFGLPVAAPYPSSIRFEPRGVVTTTGGSTIFLAGPNSGPLAVTVTAAGSVRTWRKTGNSWQ